MENVDEIFRKIKENRYVSSYDIAKEPNIDHKIVLRFYLRKTEYRNSMLGCHTILKKF